MLMSCIVLRRKFTPYSSYSKRRKYHSPVPSQVAPFPLCQLPVCQKSEFPMQMHDSNKLYIKQMGYLPALIGRDITCSIMVSVPMISNHQNSSTQPSTIKGSVQCDTSWDWISNQQMPNVVEFLKTNGLLSSWHWLAKIANAPVKTHSVSKQHIMILNSTMQLMFPIRSS